MATPALDLETTLLVKREALERGYVPVWPKRFAEDTPEALYAFITERCFTYNESSGEVALIPPHDYVKAVCRIWWHSRKTGTPLIIEKSRRLIMSWVLRGCELWAMGLRREARVIAGLNYPKAAEHVWRYYHLYTEMQKRFPQELYPSAETPARGGNVAAKSINEFYLPNLSSVTALNQEGDSFQGSGYSGVTMEEASLYARLRTMYAQALIVCEGKPGSTPGQVVIITNSSPEEEWQDIKRDPAELDDPVEITEPALLDLPIGCEARMSVTGAIYLRIHYTADPGKRSADFRIRGRRSMGEREWDSQMEMKETTFDGEPVFPQYIDEYHCPLIIREKGYRIPVESHSVLIGGLDAGQTLWPAFVVGQLCLDDEMDYQVHALAEITVTEATPMVVFAPMIHQLLRDMFPARYADVIIASDQTVMTRSGGSGETAFQIAKKKGLDLYAVPNTLEPRLGAVTWLLTRECGGRGDDAAPGLIVDQGCKVLRKALSGGYRFQENRLGGTGNNRVLRIPAKNNYSHIADAFQYMALLAQSLIEKPKRLSKYEKQGRFRTV